MHKCVCSNSIFIPVASVLDCVAFGAAAAGVAFGVAAAGVAFGAVAAGAAFGAAAAGAAFGAAAAGVAFGAVAAGAAFGAAAAVAGKSEANMSLAISHACIIYEGNITLWTKIHTYIIDV